MQQIRPAGLVTAVACSVALGLTFIVFAAISAASGHGVFSVQIGVLLAAYGLILIAAGAGLWRLRLWARGPVAAFALMSGFGFGEYLLEQPWMWLLVLLCLATVVGVVLPSTTRALKERVSSADPRPPTAWPQRLLGRFGRSQRTP
ncbi:MAG: hypothetical protein QM582_07405 [Micropruina sp.]|uniref:hypothetical protein n=1 Tax=Micropruina sp. TaxID=2737536 RepID=UPI0039E43376